MRLADEVYQQARALIARRLGLHFPEGCQTNLERGLLTACHAASVPRLETYLAWRRDVMGESETESQRRGFRLFPVHNKYTPEDWRWLLAKAGFAVRQEAELRPAHRIFVTTPAP